MLECGAYFQTGISTARNPDYPPIGASTRSYLSSEAHRDIGDQRCVDFSIVHLAN
jgi:hypothetical protein